MQHLLLMATWLKAEQIKNRKRTNEKEKNKFCSYLLTLTQGQDLSSWPYVSVAASAFLSTLSAAINNHAGKEQK